MKVLFVTSEAYPFIKTGGLGDVSYSLPKELKKLGIDVRVILPKYSEVSSNFKSKMKQIDSYSVPVGWRNSYCGLQYLEYEGIPFYFVDNEYYFKRHVSYGFYDDGERFAFFCRAILESIGHMGDFTPDVIHLNDWQTGMIPVLLNEHYKKNGQLLNTKTMFTIHNLKYQGVFPKEILEDLLSLSWDYFKEDALKYYDAVSFMKGGINFSDLITTVSKTYVNEVKTPFYGEGLHGLLNSLGNKFSGIVNGIDFQLYNPNNDKAIWKNYNENNIKSKIVNKLELQKLLNFPVNKDIPVIGIVSRLVKQKGFDLVAQVIEELLSLDLQIVVLGTGEENFEDLFEYYSSIYPSRISSNIYFSSDLAQKIYAGSDMFLMPSLFEPCGIGQLIALRYGTIPIVRETGGLKDTVVPYNEFTDEGNGFSFANYNGCEMINIIKYALSIYRNKDKWEKLVKNAMKENNSWENSAREYRDLYYSLIK
ncbi:glycogen synthase GlgA [Clostridium rectalis]|uniref:glycogen synthase GlgA n=1 Tax=Clostridium rectalis TaxID=2040295 RepID=UPI000F632C9B|nr:glycogen synthase GlgA [Clostridium rectalis]